MSYGVGTRPPRIAAAHSNGANTIELAVHYIVRVRFLAGRTRVDDGATGVERQTRSIAKRMSCHAVVVVDSSAAETVCETEDLIPIRVPVINIEGDEGKFVRSYTVKTKDVCVIIRLIKIIYACVVLYIL